MSRIARFKLPDGRIAKYSVPDDFAPSVASDNSVQSDSRSVGQKTLAEKASEFVSPGQGFNPGSFVSSAARAAQNVLPVSVIPGRNISDVPEVGLPFMSGTTGRMEEVGQKVNRAYEESLNNYAYSPSNYPELKGSVLGTVEGIRSMSPMQGLAPSDAATAVGAEAMLPIAFGPLKSRAAKVRKLVGNNFVGTSVDSLKKSRKLGTPDLGERFLRSKLSPDRETAYLESSDIIDKLENKIQNTLDNAVSAGKVGKPDVAGDAFDVASKKFQEPTVLPSGLPIARFSDEPGRALKPNEPRFTSYERPEELNLMTKGKKFTKGESKGLFNPEDPAIEAQQIKYLKQERADDILKAREAFRKRMSDPEYEFGIGKKFAISRNDVANSVDSIVEEAKKTGFESETSLNNLIEMKDNFNKSHPEYADVQYWNDVKRAIYQKVGNKNYLKDVTSDKVDAMMGVAKAIKGEIEKVVPEIENLNLEQGNYIEIRNSLGAILDRKSKGDVVGTLKSSLKDEAAVRAARKQMNFNTPRGFSAATLPIVINENRR